MPATNEILQGRYRIVAPMGQNGTGPIYQAYDETLKADVVLRELPVRLSKVTTPSKMDSMRTAFTEEAKVLSGITHEAFIRIRDHFSEIDRHYLVLESADGDYLSELIERNIGAFPVVEVSAWADQILEGLNHLHTKMPPLVHGDIKPQNIKITSEGKIKVLALGVARDAEKGSLITEQAFDATALHYLPLEQIWSNLDLASQKVIAGNYDEASEELLTQPPDARSDIYGIGATLYHLLTGQRPIDALERSIDLLEGKSDPLQTASKLNSDVPPEISYVLMKAMEIRREKRFESVLIMRQVLKTAAVRAKERAAQDYKKQPAIAAPQITLPEPKDVMAYQSAPAPAAEVEIDPQRQLELIKARLLEAENRRQLAEQRAVDAERRLHEKEIEISKAPEETVLDIPESPKSAAVLRAVDDDLSQVLEVPEKPLASNKPRQVPAKPAREFEFSYQAEPKARGSQWKLLAAAAVLIVVGGGAFGIWMMSSGGSKQQSIQPPVMSLNDTAKPEPTAEIPAQTNETASQAASENSPADESASPAQNVTSANPAAIKTKAAPQPTKPAIAAKTPAKQKKAITVDDLINDN